MNNPLTVVTEAQDLDQLGLNLLNAKRALSRAQEDVREAEVAIIAAVGAETEGSFTVRGDRCKITTTQPIARSVDKDTALAISRELPADIFEAMFDFKPSLNVRLFKECEHLRPEIYSQVAKAVTSKPGKIAVKVEVLS